MRFNAAHWLVLLLGVAGLAVAYVVQQRRRPRYAVRFTNLALLDAVAPQRPGWRRHLPAAAFLLALTSLVVAYARPTRNVQVPRDRATVMVAIDTSVSMEATDVLPNRITAAKVAATDFVDQVPRRFQLGLVSFSGTAQVLVSPTTDRELVKRNIDLLQLGPRTAIGEAVFASLSAIQTANSGMKEGEVPPATIVLMSDGETTFGRPNEEAAQAASEAGVPVSTIAYGTDNGLVIVQDRAVSVPVNKEALQRLADFTGGKAFEAASGEELGDVYKKIGSSIGYTTERREITSWFVGFGLVLGALAAAGSLLWFSRLP